MRALKGAACVMLSAACVPAQEAIVDDLSSMPRAAALGLVAHHARSNTIADRVDVRLRDVFGNVDQDVFIRRWCYACPRGPVLALELADLRVFTDRRAIRVWIDTPDAPVFEAPAGGSSALDLLAAHLPPITLPAVSAALGDGLTGPWFDAIEWEPSADIIDRPGEAPIVRLRGFAGDGREAELFLDAETGRLQRLRAPMPGGDAEIELRFTELAPGDPATWTPALDARPRAASIDELRRD
ncbi:MAG: hypothetical protein EA378_08205 [Phycisphaerales bacterium]|nr:MAG: hypothetical protein EA378_08205 [Phycisphaerales bacterium]